MDKLIEQICATVKDYRHDEGITITSGRITQWINQFDEKDREFLLEELAPILEDRYASKENIISFLKDILQELTKSYKFKDIPSFLDEAVFLDLQEEGKSQKVLLSLLADILSTEYEYNINDCGRSKQKYFVYLDDILCTGNTLFNDIIEWAGKGKESYLEMIENDKIELIFAYVFKHSNNYYKLRARLRKNSISKFTFWWYKEIDNSLSPTTQLNLILPIEDDQPDIVIDYHAKVNQEVESYCAKRGYALPNDNFYRDKSIPKTESFFSNPENRIRFENIILKKGVEILNAAHSNIPNMRALGFALPSHKNFGFGTLCFTWRNVPNNTPLVFWYSGGNFFPLFEKHTNPLPLFNFKF